jgi:hypothetical protein
LTPATRKPKIDPSPENPMRHFNELSALWRAPAFHRAFFQDVAYRWKGIGLRLLLLVLLITWPVVLAKKTVDLSHYINTQAPDDLKDFPPMTLKSGTLSSPVPQPYVYRVQGEPLFVLDTTGTVKRPGEKGAQILITDKELIQEQGVGARSLSRSPLAGMPDVTLDQAFLINAMRTVRNWLIPLGLPLMVIFSIVYRLLCALLYAVIGLALSAAFSARLRFPVLLRLAIAAMIPVLLLDTILTLAALNGCWTWLVYPVLTLVYLAYAVKTAAAVAPPAAPATIPQETPGTDETVSETDRLFP